MVLKLYPGDRRLQNSRVDQNQNRNSGFEKSWV
ncbi:uncharacterized protein METZ01_LOCUS501542, partial [marine metagenome]